jgi:hypothetical protein
MLGRLSETAREAVARGATSVRRAPESVAVRGTASARGVREVLRDIPDVVLDGAASARRALTARRLAWTAALVLAFALPFAANAARGGEATAATVALEPPARADAPALRA